MSERSSKPVCVSLLVMLLFTASSVLAHGISVFAAADGALIEGRVRSHSGDGIEGARILIKDAAGEQLAELSSSADGGFSYRAGAPVDHLIVADTGDGHQARWRVSANELTPAFRRPAANDAPQDAALSAVVERAVARQLSPLREELAAAREQVRFRDVVGGIGYLFGLAGLALWWRSRRETGGR